MFPVGCCFNNYRCYLGFRHQSSANNATELDKQRVRLSERPHREDVAEALGFGRALSALRGMLDGQRSGEPAPVVWPAVMTPTDLSDAEMFEASLGPLPISRGPSWTQSFTAPVVGLFRSLSGMSMPTGAARTPTN